MCHLSPFSVEPFIGASLLGDTSDTSFLFFCGGGCHPCHPSTLRKKWMFISPSINNLLFLIKKYPYKEMCKHICIDVIHSSQNIVSIKTQQGMF